MSDIGTFMRRLGKWTVNNNGTILSRLLSLQAHGDDAAMMTLKSGVTYNPQGAGNLKQHIRDR